MESDNREHEVTNGWVGQNDICEPLKHRTHLLLKKGKGEGA